MAAVYYATLHLWVVIKAVPEVVVNVNGLPVHTGSLFASILYMHIEERNWPLGLLFNVELDFCTLTIQMLEETLQLPVTMFLDDRGVNHVVQLEQGLQWGCCQCLLLKVLHVTVDVGLNW